MNGATGFTRVAHSDPRSRSKTAASHTYPDPPSRGEKRGLERREECCVVREMERSGATALHGSFFTQIPDLGARSGVSNDMGSPAWWAQWKETELRVVYPDPPPMRGGSGTTWWTQWLEAELYGLTRVVCPEPRLGARSGVWNDLGSPP